MTWRRGAAGAPPGPCAFLARSSLAVSALQPRCAVLPPQTHERSDRAVSAAEPGRLSRRRSLSPSLGSVLLAKRRLSLQVPRTRNSGKKEKKNCSSKKKNGKHVFTASSDRPRDHGGLGELHVLSPRDRGAETTAAKAKEKNEKTPTKRPEAAVRLPRSEDPLRD